jgi:hypothetical protein
MTSNIVGTTRPQTDESAARHSIACKECSRTRLVKKRLPQGWKHLNDTYFCPDCWRNRYVLRAVVFAVAGPLNLSWQDLRSALKTLSAETTRASNWMVKELALADVQRDPSLARIPKMPRTYLYPEARKQFPTLPSQTVAALEQAVTRTYKSKRYQIVWTCKAALPTFRYPQPVPIHNQSWTATLENDRPVVTVRLGSVRSGLRLKGGPRYHRQLSAFHLIVSGEAIQGECSIYERGSDVFVKLVAWLPRRSSANKPSGLLRVRSDADALLVAANAKDERLWSYHADQIRRWVAEHRRMLQHWADDSKFEQRPVPPFAARRQQASLRYHRRMNTAADQAAASLVGYAERRKFAAIAYDDTERGFCPEFVWFRLQQRIKGLCDERGVEFTMASGLVLAENQGTLKSE